MNAYLNYFIEANLSLVLFLAAYVLVLRNETEFKLQRIFLLAGIFISLTFPLLHLQFNGPSLPSLGQLMPSYLLSEVTISTMEAETSEATSLTVNSSWAYIQVLYALGLTFFLIRFLVRFIDLLCLLKKATPSRNGKLKIVESAKVIPSFSFFNFIVLGQAHALSLEEKQKIIRHEATHAYQLHSFDILLINILRVFFWFNPVLRSYKKILVQLHEFEADAHAVVNRDVNEYCSLLAKVALESAGFQLANHFNNSLTLKRIQMMKTIKRKIKTWKMLVFASIIPLTFMITACQDQLFHENIVTNAEEPAKPNGGMAAFYEHVGKEIRYPLEAREKGIDGKVFVEFVVNSNGSVDVTGISGIGTGCDLEAMRVVQSSPKWIPAKDNGVPVRQKLVLPISFKLVGSTTKDESKAPSGSLHEVVVVSYIPGALNIYE